MVALAVRPWLFFADAVTVMDVAVMTPRFSVSEFCVVPVTDFPPPETLDSEIGTVTVPPVYDHVFLIAAVTAAWQILMILPNVDCDGVLCVYAGVSVIVGYRLIFLPHDTYPESK